MTGTGDAAGWRLVDLDTYAALAGPLLAADPVANTVGLGVLQQALAGDGPGWDDRPTWCLLMEGDGGPPGARSAAWRTPPYGLGLAAVEAAGAESLADLLAGERAAGRPGLALDAVVGAAAAAHAFATRFAAATGDRVTGALHETLYVLPAQMALVEPTHVGGAARLAGAADLDLVTAWWARFAAEAGVLTVPVEAAAAAVAHSRMWLWEKGFEPVCMVGGRPPAAGVSRVGPVYTPPGARGQGYAAALTAHVTRRLFAAGAEQVTLYADDANRTSTGVYRRLGYRPVLSWAAVELQRSSGSGR